MAAMRLVTALAIALLGVAGCEDGRQPHEQQERRRPRVAKAHVDDGTQAIAGLRFMELVTGGAAAGDTLPLVVFFFHSHAERPEALRARFADFPARARVILPTSLESGEEGTFEWFPGHPFSPAGQTMYARALPAVEAEIAAAIAAIVEARPTVGKPIASGFSHGAGITFALALWHPDLLGVACPMAGELPADVFAGVRAPATKPALHAFIGDADPSNANNERTVAGFKSLGYPADLTVLPGFGHAFDQAQSEVFACIERAVRAAR